MRSLYDLKPAFQRRLRPVATALGRAGVTPNQITLAAFGLSALAGGAVAALPHSRGPLLGLPVVLFLRMALNALDGMMARELGLTSRLGAVLNELGDVVSDVVLYAPLAIVPGFHPALVVGIVMLAVISEMAGVVAVEIGASRRYDGPMGKSDRAFVFGALGLFVGCGVPAGPWVTVVLVLTAACAVVTILNRAARALAEVPR